MFIGAGVLYSTSDSPSGFMPTEKGKKFMEMILETPYPVGKFVDPRKETDH